MGQGIAVTPIQMAAAFSAVAYNGWAVKPRLVAQVGATVYDEVEKHRVIPGKVAREVREMLALAVAEGTGTEGADPGLRGRRQDGHRRDGRAAAATPRASTWPPSSAWCPPTTRGWSSCAP